jgi:putative component of membrane protein insertase Oxa1/YidC/SpoIIIJ protein YidD
MIWFAKLKTTGALLPVAVLLATSPFLRATESPPSDNYTRSNCHQMIGFYRHFLRPFSSSRCPLYPSCSQYSLEAIGKHGAARGILLTADRLIHEGSLMSRAASVNTPAGPRIPDPLSDNDFWWRSPR